MITLKDQFVKGATLHFECGGTWEIKNPSVLNKLNDHYLAFSWNLDGKFWDYDEPHPFNIISIDPPAKKWRMKTVEELIAEGFKLCDNRKSFCLKNFTMPTAGVIENQKDKAVFEKPILGHEEFYVEVTE